MDEEKLYNSTTEVTTDTTKCKNCGGNLFFSPTDEKLRCEYCDSVFDFDKSAGVQENDINDLFDSSDVWKDTEVYRCNNCGAKEIVSKDEIAKICSFCGTTNIIRTDELSGIKPQGVVPFKITIQEASDNATKWIKKRFFAPNAFKKSAFPEQIKGIYNPVFTFDASTNSVYSGTLGEHYTTTSTVNGRTVSHTHTRYFSISGTFSYNFDDLLVQASSKISQGTLQQIEPFPTNSANEYKTEFLNGYVANQYNKDGRVCFAEAKSLMDQRLKQQILSKYHYDVVQSFNISTTTSDVKFKYVLLPVYVGHNNWKAKLYNFYVNGFNGKFTGKAPVSTAKVLLLIFLILGFLALVFLLPMILGGTVVVNTDSLPDFFSDFPEFFE